MVNNYVYIGKMISNIFRRILIALEIKIKNKF